MTKKRPAPLNLANTKPVPGMLQTPKDIAQDITVQCLSPTLPRGISAEMLKRTQEIEYQQRQIIVQRGLDAYERRGIENSGNNGDDDPDDIKSTPSSANTTSSSGMTGGQVEGDADPPRAARSVPGSATSATGSGRPWELGKSSTPTTTLQERRGAKPLGLDVNALKASKEDDPESRAIGEDDENPVSMRKYLEGLRGTDKQRFMALCSEMWDMLHAR